MIYRGLESRIIGPIREYMHPQHGEFEVVIFDRGI